MKGKIVLAYQQNPDDPSLEHLMTERQNVEGALQEIENRRIAYSRVYGPTDERFDDLLNLFRNKENTQDILVFGFSGHASEDMLAFSNEDARTDSLAALMKKDNFPNLKLVFLNACKTNGALKYFQDAGVPIIISTNVMVHDEKAMRFASIFFDRLSQGNTVDEAIQYAYHEIGTTRHIDELRCYCYRDEHRSIDLPDHSTGTRWEVAYVDNGYKKWRIDMGHQAPQVCEPLSNCIDKERIKILHIGDESNKKAIESIDGTIVSWFSCEELEKNIFQIKREVSSADYVIIEARRYHEQFIREIDFKGFLKNHAEVIIINEDYADSEIDGFKIENLEVNVYKVIPQLMNMRMLRNSHEAQIPMILEKEVKQVFNEHKRQLIKELQRFDLINQRVDIDNLNGLEAGEDAIFNLYFIGGKGETAESSGQTFFLDVLFNETELDYNECYYLSFPPILNVRDIGTFNAYLHSTISKIKAPSVNTFDFLTYELYKMLSREEGPLTLIFDNPFQYLDSDEFLKHLEKICSSIKSKGELSRKLYLVIFDRTGFLDADVNEALSDQSESHLNVFCFKPIEEISSHDIKEWRSTLDLKIKERIPVEQIHKLEGVLSEPYLGNTINKLCLLMNAEHLITEIYPQLNAGSWS